MIKLTTHLEDKKMFMLYVPIDIGRSFIRQNYLNYNETLTNQPLFGNFNIKNRRLYNRKNF